MAPVLIVGGGCRGRRLAQAVTGEGHAVRITTRSNAGRAAIEATGAECWIGTPDRLATLRGALENVTILCWLLGTASGRAQELAALHSSRLEFFLTQAIDTTVRGVIYEAAGPALTAEAWRGAVRTVEMLGRRNAIPFAFLTVDPRDGAAWYAEAVAAVSDLFMGAANAR